MPLGEFWRRVALLLRRDQMSGELEEEMRLHVDLRTEAMCRAGLGDDDARHAARRRFGNGTMLVERSRDLWGFGWLDDMAQDFHHAMRRLAQRPAFTGAVVGVLALGVGATTAMFSAVDAAMLRPLPFVEPQELVTLPNVSVPFDPGDTKFPPSGKHGLDIDDIGAQRDLFSHIAVYAAGGLNLSDRDHPLRVNVGVVTTDFFATLGAVPLHGRLFAAEEGRPGGPRVAILSYGLWQRQFGAGDLAGRTVQLNRKPFDVVGVMPSGFSFPSESDLWIPMTVPTTFATFEGFRGFLPTTVIARAAAGVTVASASGRVLAAWEQSVAREGPKGELRTIIQELVDRMRQTGAATSLQRELVGDRRDALLVLFGATGLLLLIACANVTNLLLSDAAVRRREIAVRVVLGATRGRVVRQLLVESVALAVSGAALGLALVPVALGVIRAMMPAQLAGVAPIGVDLRVLGFATVLALVTGIGFGLWPALGSTRAAPGATIKSGGGPGATTRDGGRARRVLVIAELALTLAMLVGAGLMLRSFERVMALDRGMETGRVGTIEMAFANRAGSSIARLAALESIVDRLSAEPGIEAVGVVNDLPLRGGGGISISMSVDGVPAPPGGEMRYARVLTASSGYFAALGIPLVRGRNFKATDDSLAPDVAIVNVRMARQFWGTADALGRTFRFGMGANPKPITVIGIVGDVREGRLELEPEPQMYFAMSQGSPNNVAIVARGTLRPGALLSRMTDAVRAADPSQAVYNVRMMDDVVGASVASRRTNTLLIAAFAGLALVLAALGVYAVVAYGVAQRSRELGIRAALGATGPDLVWLIAGEMVWVTAIGLGAGLAGAWALARVLESLLYGVSAHDTLTFVLVPVVLVIPAALAALVPARRALRVNPVDVLRAD